MAGFNEIDRVRMPEGDVVGTSPMSGSGRTRSSLAASFPVPLLIIMVCLVCYGLLVVYLAISGNETYSEIYSFQRQLIGVALGIVLMVLFSQVDYRQLASYTSLLLIVNVVLIMSPHLPFIGVESNGAQSWINVGMQLQPGEFAKITVILLDASVLARYGGSLDDPREFIKALVYMGIPFLCIMTQPDLGTGLVYLVIGAMTLLIGGVRLKYLLVLLAGFVAAIAAVFVIDEVLKNITGAEDYFLLKQYQRNRLLVFLDPEADLTGSGFNLNQAMIAIGSGGLAGAPDASQSSLGFVPESATDFIFCVLAEQFGFIGALVLLGLYLALILTCISIARGASDLFGTLIVMGVVAMWLFQILENIGMDIGLMPITGIPLPFMSYGSSFMLVNFALLGLVGSVYAHR